MTNKERKALLKLKKFLNRIEDKLLKISFEISSTIETSQIYWSKLSRKARKTYEEARLIFARWSNSNIPEIYNETIRNQIRRIKSMSYIPKYSNGQSINVNYFKFVKKQKNILIKNNIVKDSIMYFSVGLDEGQKQLNRLMNLTQQINITDKAVKQSIQKGLLEGGRGLRDIDRLVGKGVVYGSQRRLQQQLMKKAIDGKYIQVLDKNGVSRMYNVRKYADLVARTEITNSNSQAVMETGLQYNSDLIQVSSHNTNTPICMQYEGKIFSISGKDRDFPPADNVPAYHPNCLHSITVVFREVLERRGIQKYSDFSKGKIEVHPTRKSHIPVSQR